MDKERREQLVEGQAPWSRVVRKSYDSNYADKPSGPCERTAAHKIDI